VNIIDKGKPIIGILGGICSGKSTVARELGKLGCAVIDADRIAHALLDTPEVLDKITASFGCNVLAGNSKIDRHKLAEIVFADAEKLSTLTDILHPPVLRNVEKLIDEFNHDNTVKAIVLDMPLLLEIRWDSRCTKLIFVECSNRLRFARAREAGFPDESQIKIREKFQISLDTKRMLADNIVENNSDFSSLVRQVADIFSNILGSG